MDDFNAPLGLDREDSSAARSTNFRLVLSGTAILVGGFVIAWFYLSGNFSLDEPRQIVAGNTRLEKDILDETTKSELRSGDQKAPQTLTESDPAKPARLDEMQPIGQLVQPKISFVNPVSTGPLKLSHRPDPVMLENSSFGKLPKISNSGKRPMDAYARPVLGQGSTRIAIVVGGLGLSQSGSKSAIEQLPGQITLAFAPYGNSISRWMKKARKDGHELLMQVPMEPVGYPEINPGKHTLVSGVAAGKNLESLHWSMARMTNYVGIMNYLGAKLQSDEVALGPVLGEINKRGLLYLDDGSAFSSHSESVAKAVGIPYARGSIVVDDARNAKAILENLLALEKLARRNGKAIGIASAFPRSVKQIVLWIEQAEKRGIEIVPVSALVK